jgi:hypothetical protein
VIQITFADDERRYQFRVSVQCDKRPNVTLPAGVFAIFNLVSIWLLRPPQKPKLAAK